MIDPIVQAVADRLIEPSYVEAVSSAPENATVMPDGRRVSPWRPGSLSEGFPSAALLFAELSTVEPAYRKVAHAHLSAALAADAPTGGGLCSGVPSLAFAAHTASKIYGGYETLLSQLDEVVAETASVRAAEDRARLARGEPIGGWERYDVIAGAAGVGRYLLARGQERPLRDVLEMLVDVANRDEVGGVRNSSWWVHNYAHLGEQGPPGHLNLGLAHGIAGPLALLALAWQADVRVRRHAEAIEILMAALEKWRHEDDFGPYWPSWLRADRPPLSGRSRDVWCYGSAGIGRALYLAGKALDNADWRELGVRAVKSAVATTNIQDFSLCHGWAGLLQVTTRMAADTGARSLREAADELAETIRAGFDPASVFGFRYTHPAAPAGTDRAGFLEGAAGVALALYSHTAGSSASWDAALLLG